MRTMTPHYARLTSSTLGTTSQSGTQRYDSSGIAIPYTPVVHTRRIATRNAVRHLLGSK